MNFEAHLRTVKSCYSSNKNIPVTEMLFIFKIKSPDCYLSSLNSHISITAIGSNILIHWIDNFDN